MMMRLALAVLLPAAAAVHTGDPVCTAASCCVPKVMGKCTGNTHDSEGRFLGDDGYVASEVAPIDCSGGDGTTATNTAVKADFEARTAADCCEAPPAPAPAWACNDKDGDGTTDDPITDTDCGAGWEAAADLTATLSAAFDVTLEAHKQACCDICASGRFAAAADACDDHTTVTCPAAKEPTVAAGDAADCEDEAGCCATCAAGKFSAGSNALCEDYKTACATLQYMTANTDQEADHTCTAHDLSGAAVTCGTGKQPKDTVFLGTATADCEDEAGCCEACPDGKFSDAADGAQCEDYKTACATLQFMTANSDQTADHACTAHDLSGAAVTCGTGKQPKDTVFLGTATADCEDEDGCCEACPDGKFSDAADGAQCVAHSTCDADEYISTAGTTSAQPTCSDCAAGKTTPAANSETACADITGYCMGNVDSDEDDELDKFECPTDEFVAQNVQTAITTAGVAEDCTEVPATGADITGVPTTCVPTGATCAPATDTATGCSCVGCSESACTALTDSTDAACAWTTGTCAVATGAGGSCTYVAKVDQVGAVADTTCPGPEHAEEKTAGAAAAAPLAVIVALVAALA